MIIVFTGNGKGKTTAALGQALRAVGRGKRALMVQFIKGPWRSGEDYSAKLLSRERANNVTGGGFVLKKMGKGFVGILGDSLPRAEHKNAAREALRYAEQELATGSWDLLVLDEVNVALSLKLLSLRDVLHFVKHVPPQTLAILTGRGAPKALLAAADYATEMREIKHPFASGKLAKIGIEF
ncbi:MAG: cob(I)yrinic acid a,c-diamide adenosyltransferase [bacterium]|nr:cob(I)yrinic acid a,c-diamide adenosyltransferase [bacterium]